MGLHWLHALVLAATGDIDEALRELVRERRSLDPNHVYAREAIANSWYVTGALLWRLGRRDDAIAAFREALKVVHGHALAMIGTEAAGSEKFEVRSVKLKLEGRSKEVGNEVSTAIGRAIVMSRINLHQMAASGCLAAIRPDSRGSPWILKREGGSHSLWTNPVSGAVEAVPRHTEIPNVLARKICRNLGIPEPGSS